MAEEQTTEIEHKTPQEEKKDRTNKTLRILSILFLVFGIVFLAIFSSQTDISTGPVVIIFLVILGISLLIFFFMKWKEWLVKKTEDEETKQSTTPKSLDYKELIEMIKKDALCNGTYINEVKQFEDIKTHNVPTRDGNDNIIYDFAVTTLYPQKYIKSKKERGYTSNAHIIYNGNYPFMGPTVLFNPSDKAIYSAIKNKAMNAEKEEPLEQRKTKTINPQTGAVTEHEEISGKPTKNEKPKEKKSGDIE